MKKEFFCVLLSISPAVLYWIDLAEIIEYNSTRGGLGLAGAFFALFGMIICFLCLIAFIIELICLNIMKKKSIEFSFSELLFKKTQPVKNIFRVIIYLFLIWISYGLVIESLILRLDSLVRIPPLSHWLLNVSYPLSILAFFCIICNVCQNKSN